LHVARSALKPQSEYRRDPTHREQLKFVRRQAHGLVHLPDTAQQSRDRNDAFFKKKCIRKNRQPFTIVVDQRRNGGSSGGDVRTTENARNVVGYAKVLVHPQNVHYFAISFDLFVGDFHTFF
jgi:3,4-dihydroxy-2-butanone 4-phosphate synthase